MKLLRCLFLLAMCVGAGAQVISFWPLDGEVDNAGTLVVPDMVGLNDGLWWDKSSEPNAPTGAVFAEGKFGNAVYTKNGYINCGNDFSLNPQQSMTLAFWLKGNSFPEGWSNVIGKGYSGYAYNRYATESDLYLRIAGTVYGAGGGSAITGAWRHYTIVLNYTNGTSQYYIDGSLIAENTYSGMGMYADPFCIGSVGDSLSRAPMDGWFDEVIMLDEPITASQVAGLMNGYGTKAFFKMESSAADSSFFNVSASLQGSPTFITGADNRGSALSLSANAGFSASVQDSQQITLATLIKADSFVAAPVITKGSASLATNANGTVKFTVGTTSLTSTAVLTAGAWASVIGTYDGVDIKLYINGKLDGTLELIGASTAGTSLSVGRSAFAGSVDDVRYCDYAFNQNDVDKEAVGFANMPPVVTASASEYGFWLSGGSKRIDIAGTIEDDGLSGIAVSSLWTSTGPANVTFGDASQASTTARFTAAGNYVLTLTADDGEFQVFDEIAITVFEDSFTGLVAYWNFDEVSGTAVADSIGGHNGTIVGSTTQWLTAGQKGGALNFGSRTARVVVPTSSAIELTGAMTVAIWMKGTFTDSYEAVISKGYGTWRVIRYAAGQQIYAQIGTANYIAAGPDVADNQWHHVVMTYDGITQKLFIDGLKVGQITYPNALNNNSKYDLWIGSDPTNSTSGWVGAVDEARLYSVALPESKVLDLFISDGGQYEVPTGCDSYYSGDVNQDCYVGLDDFVLMAQNWLKCNEKSDPDCVN